METHIFCRLQRARAVFTVLQKGKKNSSGVGQGRIVTKESVEFPSWDSTGLLWKCKAGRSQEQEEEQVSPLSSHPMCSGNPFISTEPTPLAAPLKAAPSCRFRSGWDLATSCGGPQNPTELGTASARHFHFTRPGLLRRMRDVMGNSALPS